MPKLFGKTKHREFPLWLLAFFMIAWRARTYSQISHSPLSTPNYPEQATHDGLCKAFIRLVNNS
jgi:hypothetical protein